MFGKPVVQLITPDIHAVPAGMVSRFHRVDARVTSIAFWGSLLDGVPPPMVPDAPARPLRRLFSVTWGYARDMIAPVSRRITDGETISFASGGRGRDLCLFGWSDPEPWGVWSDGPVAMLQFNPPDDLATFMVEIDLAPFVPDTEHPLSMTVWPRADATVDPVALSFQSGEVTKLRIPISAGPGSVELLFRFSGLISPRQLGLGDDSRLLGAGLHRLTLRRSDLRQALPEIV